MKLKPIPANIVVHAPTDAEAKELLAILHEDGYKWKTGHGLVEASHWSNEDTCYYIHPERKAVTWNFVFGCDGKVIFFSEFKRLYCEDEKPQPKFKVGDWVIHNHKNREVGQIVAYYPDEECRYSVHFGKEYHNMAEHQLLPYTEPETKQTEDMETKDEAKELNLCELIGDRDGIHVYCPTCGEVTLQAWDRGKHTKPLIFAQTDTSIVIRTFANGKAYTGGECCIFPSRALYEQYPLAPYAAWMKWREVQQLRILRITLTAPDLERGYIEVDFRTPEYRDKCISEIKAIIEKYSE